ncbi:hypothetical protein FHG87_018191 [Trinorchestia longiramus]|nr:hypothetical protein FHG87_018191 [Trinorchestia longiramus]
MIYQARMNDEKQKFGNLKNKSPDGIEVWHNFIPDNNRVSEVLTCELIVATCKVTAWDTNYFIITYSCKVQLPNNICSMECTASMKPTLVLHELTDAELKRLCCRHDFIKQEAAAENFVHVDTPNPRSLPQAMIIKMEIPDDELNDITVKEEPIDWDQESEGLRVNADAYVETLQTIVKHWIDNVANGRAYVFQQDSVPFHKALKTQDCMAENFHDHVTPNLWPPNSPDLNALDYYV